MGFLKLLLGPLGILMDGFGEQTSEEDAKNKPRAPIGTPKVRILISLAITLVFGIVYYYFKLPALNIHNSGLYWFIVWMVVVFSACMIFMSGYRGNYAKDYVVQARKDLPIPFGIIAVLVVVVTIGSIAGWALFNAKSYAQLLTVEEGDFTAEVSEINWNQIPMLDEDSANNRSGCSRFFAGTIVWYNKPEQLASVINNAFS